MTSEYELTPRSQSRLKILQSIITNYDGSVPFHHYLKSIFRKNKSFGSNDRKIYRSWSYAWFRIGNAIVNQEFETRIFIASFVVNGIRDKLSEDLAIKYFGFIVKDELIGTVNLRLGYVKKVLPDFEIGKLLNQIPEFSNHVNEDEYAMAMLHQPEVFLRINKSNLQKVLLELTSNNISFNRVEQFSNCISVPSGTNLDFLQAKQKHCFEVQDKTSQLIAEKIPAIVNESIWDCCCGAGGKSLALIDRVSNINILASDKRLSVLQNFQSRIPNSAQQNIKIIQADLEDHLPDEINVNMFDGIIADVPCSGSGTWPRNPENLLFFKSTELREFHESQIQILKHVSAKLKPGGWLFYITCSVFKMENEDVVHWAVNNLELKLKEDMLIEGFSSNCDSMYYALFYK